MKSDRKEKNPKVGKMSSVSQRWLYKDGYCQCYLRKKNRTHPISPKCFSV